MNGSEKVVAAAIVHMASPQLNEHTHEINSRGKPTLKTAYVHVHVCGCHLLEDAAEHNHLSQLRIDRHFRQDPTERSELIMLIQRLHLYETKQKK